MKKFLCGVVAAAMIFSVVPVMPANTTVANAAMIDVKEGSIVGLEDRTSGFWSDVTKGLKLDDGQTLTAVFENHGSTNDNWQNYTFAFMTHEDMSNGTPQRADGTYMEYAIVRADNYAVGGDWAAKVGMSYDEKAIEFVSDVDWDSWKDVVQDSNVEITMSRVKNLVSIQEVITNIADPSKKFTTTLVVSVGKAAGDESYNENVYVAFTIDNAYLKFKKYEVTKTTGDVEIKEPEKVEPIKTTPNVTVTQSATIKFKKGKKSVSKVTLKKGKKVTLKGSVTPKNAKLSLGKLSKKDKKIVKVTFKNKKLTIKAKKKGKVTLKITSAKTGSYVKTTKKIKVTVK